MIKHIRLCVTDSSDERHDVRLDIDTAKFGKFYRDYTAHNRRQELLSSSDWRDPGLPSSWSSRYSTRYAFRCDGHDSNGGEMKFLIRTFNDSVRHDNIYLWLCAFSDSSIYDDWNDEHWSVHLTLEDISKLRGPYLPGDSVVKFKILKQ